MSIKKTSVGSLQIELGGNQTKEQSELVVLAAQDFGFLLQRNEALTFKSFADRIGKAYSTENPRTATIVNCLSAM